MTQGKAQPAYATLAGDLRQRISSGEFPPGAMIPSESVLMQEYGHARGTVRQALATLEREGLVESQTGRGRRVSGQAAEGVQPSTRYEDVAAQLREAIKAGEYSPDVRLPGEPVLAARFGTARITVRKALELLQQEGLIIVIPSKGRRRRPSKARSTSTRIRHRHPQRPGDHRTQPDTTREARHRVSAGDGPLLLGVAGARFELA